MGNKSNTSSQVTWWIRRQNGYLSEISLVPKPMKGFLRQRAASSRSRTDLRVSGGDRPADGPVYID